jgi:hypothetical protein
VVPEGYIYPKAERAVRDLLRKRAHLVRQHTANVLSVQNIMARNTGARFSVKRIHELTKQDLTTLLAEETQVLAVTSSLVVLDCLRQQIKTLEQTVHKRLHHTPAYEQLLTVQGIGTILAQTITLETGAISRFPSVGNYASYCRCVDSTKRFLAPFGDMTLWNILASGVVIPYISPYPRVTNLMLGGHILSVAPKTLLMEGGDRFHRDTSHDRPCPLVARCDHAAPRGV